MYTMGIEGIMVEEAGRVLFCGRKVQKLPKALPKKHPLYKPVCCAYIDET